MTTDAIDQLITIFKSQAKKAKDAATAQRLLKGRAQAQRVLTEANHQEDIEMPTTKHIRNTPDDHLDTSTPAENTRLQRKVRTITQDYLFHMMDTPSLVQPFTNKQAAARKYPLQLQFLCDFTNAVLDDETGDLLEYRHLLKHPKYRDVWSNSFGKEIR